jgi:hypothetical protein
VREILESHAVAVVRRMIRCGEKPPLVRTKAANVLHKPSILMAVGDGPIHHVISNRGTHGLRPIRTRLKPRC